VADDDPSPACGPKPFGGRRPEGSGPQSEESRTALKMGALRAFSCFLGARQPTGMSDCFENGPSPSHPSPFPFPWGEGRGEGEWR
jgi:hypothetical protein